MTEKQETNGENDKTADVVGHKRTRDGEEQTEATSGAKNETGINCTETQWRELPEELDTSVPFEGGPIASKGGDEEPLLKRARHDEQHECKSDGSKYVAGKTTCCWDIERRSRNCRGSVQGNREWKWCVG